MHQLWKDCRNIVQQSPKVRRNSVSQPLKVFAHPPLYSTDPQTLLYPALFFSLSEASWKSPKCFFRVFCPFSCFTCNLMLHTSVVWYIQCLVGCKVWILARLNSQSAKAKQASQAHLEAVKCQLLFFYPVKSTQMGAGEKRPFQTV